MGAAIAAGNHLEKGICALLVMAAVISANEKTKEKDDSEKNIMFQYPKLTAQAIEIKINASPIRLVRAVIIPAPKDLAFW